MCEAMGRHFYMRSYSAALNFRSYRAAFVRGYLWCSISMFVAMGLHLYVRNWGAAFNIRSHEAAFVYA